jgi:peptidylprolyl isomerase
MAESKKDTLIRVQNGDFVKIYFTGRLEDGTVFAKSKESKPVSFRLGSGEVITGLEKAVVGMSPGESRTAQIPPEDAFGQYRKDRLITVRRRDFPKHIEPRKGQFLRVTKTDGRTGMVRVSVVDDDRVILDTNHVLAGEKISLDITLLECSSAVDPLPEVTDAEKTEVNFRSESHRAEPTDLQKGM